MKIPEIDIATAVLGFTLLAMLTFLKAPYDLKSACEPVISKDLRPRRLGFHFMKVRPFFSINKSLR